MYPAVAPFDNTALLATDSFNRLSNDNPLLRFAVMGDAAINCAETECAACFYARARRLTGTLPRLMQAQSAISAVPASSEIQLDNPAPRNQHHGNRCGSIGQAGVSEISSCLSHHRFRASGAGGQIKRPLACGGQTVSLRAFNSSSFPSWPHRSVIHPTSTAFSRPVRQRGRFKQGFCPHCPRSRQSSDSEFESTVSSGLLQRSQSAAVACLRNSG